MSGYKCAKVRHAAMKMHDFVQKNKGIEKLRGVVEKYKLPEFGRVALADLDGM